MHTSMQFDPTMACHCQALLKQLLQPFSSLHFTTFPQAFIHVEPKLRLIPSHQQQVSISQINYHSP